MSWQAVRASLRDLAREARLNTGLLFGIDVWSSPPPPLPPPPPPSCLIMTSVFSVGLCQLSKPRLAVPAVVDLNPWSREVKQWQRKQSWLFVQHLTITRDVSRGLPEMLPPQEICHDSSLRVVAMAVAPALGRSLIPPTWKPTTPWWTPAWIHFQAERLQILMGFGAQIGRQDHTFQDCKIWGRHRNKT